MCILCKSVSNQKNIGTFVSCQNTSQRLYASYNTYNRVLNMIVLSKEWMRSGILSE